MLTAIMINMLCYGDYMFYSTLIQDFLCQKSMLTKGTLVISDLSYKLFLVSECKNETYR